MTFVIFLISNLLFSFSNCLLGINASRGDLQRPIIFRLRSDLENEPFAPTPQILGPQPPSTVEAASSLMNIAAMQPLLEKYPKQPEIGEFDSSPEPPSEDEIEGLKRHRLHQYYIIEPHDFGGRDPSKIVGELLANPLVDYAEEEPIAVSVHGTGQPSVEVFSSGSIPDLTDCKKNLRCQRYMYGFEESGKYKLSGVNAIEAHKLANNTGENVRIMQVEDYHPDWDHIDLPKPW